MRRDISILLIILLSLMLINICYADENTYTWKNVKITIPSGMIFSYKENMAIIANSTENPSSFLVISGMKNLTSIDIIQNLRKNNHVVEIKEIKNTQVGKYNCVYIAYIHNVNKEIHISYLFDDYNVRLIYVGSYKEFKQYEPIIKTLTITSETHTNDLPVQK